MFHIKKYQTLSVSGNDVTVAGWGTDNVELGTSPDNLHRMNAPIYDFVKCKSDFIAELPSQNFCLEVKNYVSGCFGDSGSAVVRDGIQFGVFIWVADEFCNSVGGSVRIEDPVIRNFIAEQARV